MRERLVTLLCAVGAIVLFLTLFMRGDARADREVPRPTTQERGENGYHTAMEWLDASRFRVLSLRERYDKLERRPDLAKRGNILVVTLPATAIFKTEEFRPLDRWVRAGNTLLVLAALADNPDWAFARSGLTSSDLNLLTGLDFETARSRSLRLAEAAKLTNPTDKRSAERQAAGTPPPPRNSTSVTTRIEPLQLRLTQPARSELRPNREHAYFKDVREAVAFSDYASQPWAVRVPYEGFVLELAHQSSGEGVFWTRPLGEGRIVVSGYGSLFTNRALGEGDNARLLANIVGADLGANGAVLFDDVHQGLGAAYDPARFYKDRRLHLTILIMALVWLCWVIGGTRLRMPVTRVSAPRETELVRKTGDFLARVVTPAAAARRMIEQFLRRFPWPLVERHPRIPPSDVVKLKDWYAAACASERVPLVKVHNLLMSMRRQLSA